MNNLRTAAQQALDRLQLYHHGTGFSEDAECIAALRAALAKEEEAAAWLAERKEHWRKEKEKAQTTKDHDPELSAALGWPGGISDPVLDRTQLLQMVAEMRVEQQPDSQPNTCTWRDNMDAIFETECGNMHIINDGSPEDNRMKYCCYCGKEIKDESPT